MATDNSGQQKDEAGNQVILNGVIFVLKRTRYHGTYRGTVESFGIAGSRRPSGIGNFDGDEEFEGYSYSGEWRDGKPCGKGWWRWADGDVYAGNVGGSSIRQGHGVYWSENGRDCFEGEWDEGYPMGEGTMLREDGDLWQVDFTGLTWLWKKPSWDKSEKIALLGRVVAGGPAPLARREDRGALPDWFPTIVTADGREEQWWLCGLTKKVRDNTDKQS